MKENVTQFLQEEFSLNANGVNFQKDAKEKVVAKFTKNVQDLLAPKRKDVPLLVTSSVKDVDVHVLTKKFLHLANN